MIKESTARIGSLEIGRHRPPVFIAELSGNHNGDLERALTVVDAMADAGAPALKLQTYTADTLTIDADTEDFVIQDPSSPWHGRTLYELYEEAHTPWAWHEPIMERAASHGMVCFSSPFDSTAVDFLEELDVPAYKIASFESADHALVRRVARTGRPVIISTGAAGLADIAETVAVARGAGCDDLILLHCTSAYPSLPSDADLATMAHMREAFDCEVGLSDHTLGIGVPIAAVALGATVIEKHVTIDRLDGGVDSAFSLEPDEVRQLVEQATVAWQARGRVRYDVGSAEQASMRFRRSLYVVEPVEAGEVFTSANVRSIRPGFGLAPQHLPTVLGRRASRRVARATPVSWDLVT